MNGFVHHHHIHTFFGSLHELMTMHMDQWPMLIVLKW